MASCTENIGIKPRPTWPVRLVFYQFCLIQKSIVIKPRPTWLVALKTR